MGGELAGGRGRDPEKKLVRGKRTLARVVDEQQWGEGSLGQAGEVARKGERLGLATNSLWQVRKTEEVGTWLKCLIYRVGWDNESTKPGEWGHTSQGKGGF